MKPPVFKYHDPRSVSEAVSLLSSLDNARVLAGGQSLMPMLNMRLANPDHIVDVNRVPELSGIRVEGETVRIGAMTRQRDVELHPEVRRVCPLLHEGLGFVGHVQTRNRGTIGGSLAHMDPAAELPAVVAALDGVLTAEGPDGVRDIPMSEFPITYMTTSLQPNELLTSVSLPAWPREAGHAFVEFARRRGDFAIVAVAAMLLLTPDGSVSRVSLALTGVGPAPVRALGIESALQGQPASDETFRAAATDVVRELDPESDIHASREYRLRLASVLTRRALTLARDRAWGGSPDE